MNDRRGTIKDQIEELIDKSNLSMFLEVVEEICHDKAEHIRCEWQDQHLANRWDRDGTRIGSVAYKSGI